MLARRGSPWAGGSRPVAPVALGLADMPGGTLVGTVVHGVLERIDFEAAGPRGRSGPAP